MYSIFAAFPYITLMLSLALAPLLLPKFWHNFEKHILAVLTIWTFAVVIQAEGGAQSLQTISHMLFHEYIAFIAIIFALFAVSGGINIQFNLADSLQNNLLILLIGALLANFIGTTGASMVLIRPFLKLNHNRPYKTHLGVFFIFIVANIGGSLTPLGDPPLFLGYLSGVNFTWTLINGWLPLIITVGSCLSVFAFIDRIKNKHHVSQRHNIGISIEGRINIVLMACIVILTLIAPVLGKCQDVARNIGYVVIGIISLVLTPKHIHKEQHFNFDPFKEVARVFWVIFLSLIPISAMLKMGSSGPFSALFDFAHFEGLPIDTRYFWLSGSLSSFLDNAPTYLLFFKMAGGNAQILMNQLPSTLLAISLGSVYMGAITYIGNAPNFMVRSIAKQSGVEMPSFMGYIAWSSLILLPILYVISSLLKYF
jgi:Na+/H+ antiporter NhaD/arsenite permease-like protein